MKIALSIPGFPDIDRGATPLPTWIPTGGLDTTGGHIISTFIDVLLIAATIYAVWLI